MIDRLVALAAHLESLGHPVIADKIDHLLVKTAVTAPQQATPVTKPSEQVNIGFIQDLRKYNKESLGTLQQMQATYEQQVQQAQAQLQQIKSATPQTGSWATRTMDNLLMGGNTDPNVFAAESRLKSLTTYRDEIAKRIQQIQSGDQSAYTPPPMQAAARPANVPANAIFNAKNQTWSTSGREGNPWNWKTWGNDGREITNNADDLNKPENEWYRKYLDGKGYTGDPNWKANSTQSATDYTGSGRPDGVPENATWNYETQAWVSPIEKEVVEWDSQTGQWVRRKRWLQPTVWNQHGQVVETPEDVQRREKERLDTANSQPMIPWADWVQRWRTGKF